MVEYRVRPVTRYIVTKFTSDERGESSGTCGEFDNADVAYEVGYALAKAERERLELPPGSMEVIFPERPRVQKECGCNPRNVLPYRR